MDLATLTPHLLHPFSSEADLLSAVAELSKKFTTDRSRIGDYLRDERLTSAYTAFYFSTNFPKFEAVLPWLPSAAVESFRNSFLIDVGAGPGTFSLAFRHWRGPGEVLQIETSELMRQQAKRLWEGLYPGEGLLQNTQIETSKPKLMIFGHSANEMTTAEAMNYVRTYSPEQILFIEPGTKEFFTKMLKIREELFSRAYRIQYPCPQSASCPLQDTDDWCHQYVHVRHSVDVERLTQKAGRDRRNLPLIVHHYALENFGERADERLLRVFPETKFSFEWDVCHENRKEHYQVQKRGLSKSQQKAIGTLTPGDALRTELEKEFDGVRRVRLRT